jgi:antitoxin YefM
METTYSNARANLASYCDAVTKNRETLIIHRRGAEDVALVAASELAGLVETAHLLRSPKNAERILSALLRARKGDGSPQEVSALAEEIGLAFE